MAPKKKPYNELSKSAKFYRDNPKAKAVKKKKDTEVNARPEQRKKRSILSTKNKQADKRGINRNGKDLSHTKNGLVYKESSSNRGSKSDSSGDRKARGNGCKKKK